MATVVVLRHGARQPIAPSGLKACIARAVGNWRNARGRLTALGRRQHRLLGAWFADYAQQHQCTKVNIAWAPEETRRCELSARAFMQGLRDKCPSMTPVVLNRGSQKRWGRIFRSHKSCKRFLDLQDKLEARFDKSAADALATSRAAFTHDMRQLLSEQCAFLRRQAFTFDDAVKALRQFVQTYELTWKHGRLTRAAHVMRRKLAASVKKHFHVKLYCLQAAYFRRLHWDVPSSFSCMGIGQLASVIARNLKMSSDNASDACSFYFAHDSTLLRLLSVLGVAHPNQPDFAAFVMLRQHVKHGVQYATNLAPWSYSKCHSTLGQARMRAFAPRWRNAGTALDTCAIHDAHSWRSVCANKN